MTKINPKFIDAMQERLDEKEPEYGGEDNPKNYRNLSLHAINNLVGWHCKVFADLFFKFKHNYPDVKSEDVKKKLADISNFCWMLWERLESK
jgi:hypothetical protein